MTFAKIRPSLALKLVAPASNHGYDEALRLPQRSSEPAKNCS
jgi:hypothetical protein